MAIIQDSGNAETEALLIDTEYKIQDIYARAARETQEKLEDYFAGFQRRDAQKQALVESGRMSESDYLKWRKNQMLTGQRWKDMVDALTEDHVNADKLAMSVVRGHLPDVYAINNNYATYEIEKGTGLDTTFTLYDRQSVERLVREEPDLLPNPDPEKVPADRRWNRQHIRNEIQQAILQGEPLKETAKRLQRVTDMDERAAMRNARTAMTGAQNAGRVDGYKRAESMGIKLKQQWLATLDNHTRHEHRQLDGQSVKVGEPFEVEGEKIRFPGDPQAAPHLIYNCRCTLIADLEGFENDPKDLSLRYDDRLEGMSYDEWKNAKIKTDDKFKSEDNKIPLYGNEADKSRMIYGKTDAMQYSASGENYIDLVGMKRKRYKDGTFGDLEKINHGSTEIPENENTNNLLVFGLPNELDRGEQNATPNYILTNGRIALNPDDERDNVRIKVKSMVENECYYLGGIRKEGHYYRVMGSDKELEYIKKGTIRPSVNHMTGKKEDGLSCWEYPKYGTGSLVEVKGGLAAIGSDGEPVVDIATLEFVRKVDDAAELYKKGKEIFCERHNWTMEQLEKALKGDFSIKR